MDERPAYFAYIFDGQAGAQTVGLHEVHDFSLQHADHTFCWIHLDRSAHQSRKRLEDANLDHFVIDALIAEETRPRCTVHGDGVLLNLRGVNLNPGSEPEDMVSIRFWIEKSRVISLALRPLLATSDLRDAIERHEAPSSPGELIARFALRLADRTEPTVTMLNEKIDLLEEKMLDQANPVPRDHLAEIRRMAIILRRYMIPQKDALTTLEIEDFEWLANRDRSRLREAAERVARLGEELDSIRDRAQVVNDQIMDRRAETMNRQMLILSVVAAFFLPLGLITGLLGVNVGGIPGTDSPWAFEILSGLLVLIGFVQLWLFRRLGMF